MSVVEPANWSAVVLVLVQYVLVTAVGLTVARVLVHFVLGAVKRPDKPVKKDYAACAAESLRMATELRMNATAVFDQLAGKGRRV